MMKRNLRNLLMKGSGFAGLSDPQGEIVQHTSLCWQGDFGKGVPTGSGVWSDPGIAPNLLYGPAPAAGVSNQGVPTPQFRLGMAANGDFGSEFLFCKLVLAGVTDLLPGDCYFIDGSFALTLFSTTNASNIIGAEVGIGQVFAPAQAAGTYYLWVQRAGRAAVRAIAGSVANGKGEANATTAGTMKFPAAATAGQKSASPVQGYLASSGIQFTGNTVNGSPTIKAVASSAAEAGITNLMPGMTITGTNLPSNACIAAIRRVGNAWEIDIGTSTTGGQATLQNCSGTATGTTFTVTTHVTANLYWATLAVQN